MVYYLTRVVQSPISFKKGAHDSMKKISRNIPSSAPLDSSQHLLSSPLRPVGNSASIAFEDATVPAQYPHRLSLYLQAPAYEISIEDFEELALARLERNI